MKNHVYRVRGARTGAEDNPLHHEGKCSQRMIVPHIIRRKNVVQPQQRDIFQLRIVAHNGQVIPVYIPGSKAGIKHRRHHRQQHRRAGKRKNTAATRGRHGNRGRLFRRDIIHRQRGPLGSIVDIHACLSNKLWTIHGNWTLFSFYLRRLAESRLQLKY